VDRVDDLSGIQPQAEDWFDVASLPDTCGDLLREVGRVYVPLLLANADAIRDNKGLVETIIDGTPWQQSPFLYQVKCLASLRNTWASLSPQDQTELGPLMSETGCDLLF
jgi:hypothetical protein